MDLANQSKTKNYLITILVVVNLLSVSIIWMQTARIFRPAGRAAENPPPDAVQLMQKALDLDEVQTARLREVRKSQLAPAKSYNDRLDALKMELAEELLKDHPDTAVARDKAQEIGQMQTRVEIIRFDHFRDLLALCSPEQRQKMAPVIRALYNRKAPQPASSAERPRPASSKAGVSQTGKPVSREGFRAADSNATAPPPREIAQSADDGGQGVVHRQGPGTADNGRQGPPSLEEKLDRLSRRLDLSAEQSLLIRQVLEQAQARGRQAGKRIEHNTPEFAAEREKNRRAEDEAIMKVLTPPQQQEYQRMIDGRK